MRRSTSSIKTCLRSSQIRRTTSRQFCSKLWVASTHEWQHTLLIISLKLNTIRSPSYDRKMLSIMNYHFLIFFPLLLASFPLNWATISNSAFFHKMKQFYSHNFEVFRSSYKRRPTIPHLKLIALLLVRLCWPIDRRGIRNRRFLRSTFKIQWMANRCRYWERPGP